MLGYDDVSDYGRMRDAEMTNFAQHLDTASVHAGHIAKLTRAINGRREAHANTLLSTLRVAAKEGDAEGVQKALVLGAGLGGDSCGDKMHLSALEEVVRGGHVAAASTLIRYHRGSCYGPLSAAPTWLVMCCTGQRQGTAASPGLPWLRCWSMRHVSWHRRVGIFTVHEAAQLRPLAFNSNHKWDASAPLEPPAGFPLGFHPLAVVVHTAAPSLCRLLIAILMHSAVQILMRSTAAVQYRTSRRRSVS